MSTYWNIFKASVANSFRLDTAFVFNNWANLLSTTAYTVSWIIFFEVIYGNTESIAGYTRNEMLFFVLFAQISFYLVTGIFAINIVKLITDVNTGHFDLLLLKPVPSLFYTLIRKLSIVSTTRDALLPTIVILLAVDFGALQLDPINILVGLIAVVLGSAITYLILLISALPAFWLGESSNLYGLAQFVAFDMIDDIPYEGFGKIPALQIFFTAVVPFLISTGMASSIALGKTDIFTGLIITLLAFAITIGIVNVLWKLSLKNYGSASS